QLTGAGVSIDYTATAWIGLYGSFPVSGSVGDTRTDYTFFEPDEGMKERNRRHYEQTKKNFYNEYGTLAEFKITDFQYPELDRKIEALRRELAEAKKDRAKRFEALVSKAKTFASGNNFEEARKTLTEAEKMMEGQA